MNVSSQALPPGDDPSLRAIDDALDTLLHLKEAAMLEREKILAQHKKNEEPTAFSYSFASTLSHGVLALENILYQHSALYSSNRLEKGNPLEASQYSKNDMIKMSVTSERIVIHMPHLPPRTSRNAIVTEALASKLFHMTTLPRWPRCVMDFYHVYPIDIPKMPKDVDNYAYKRTIDLLMYALQSSDCAKAFRDSRQTVFTDSYPQGTYIVICPESSEKAVYDKFESAVFDLFTEE